MSIDPPVIVMSIDPWPSSQFSFVKTDVVVKVAVFSIVTKTVSEQPLSSRVIISQSSANKFDN